MQRITGNSWSAMLKNLKASMGVYTAWTEDQLNRLSLRQVIELCQDRTAWHKDLFRHPAPPCRVYLNGDSRFEQIVYINEYTFLFVPKDDHERTRRVTPSNTGDLRGIGSLPVKEYKHILLETWLGLAKYVLVGINGNGNGNSNGNPNHGSIHHWVPGHWRQLSSGRHAYKVAPWGEDRRHFSQTWVCQYHVHNDDGALCTKCHSSMSRDPCEISE